MIPFGRMMGINTIGGLILPVLVIWLDQNWSWAEFRLNLLYSMLYSHSIGTTVTLAFATVGPRLGRMRPVQAWAAVIGILVASAFIG